MAYVANFLLLNSSEVVVLKIRIPKIVFTFIILKLTALMLGFGLTSKSRLRFDPRPDHKVARWLGVALLRITNFSGGNSSV